MNKRGILFVVIPILVIVFGLVGYCGYLQYGFYQGLLSSLKLLKVEFGEVTNNIFIETARCLGIVFYFSLLYAIAYALFDALRLFINVRYKDSIAIHGDSPMAGFCASNIQDGKHCVQSDNKESFKARRQIIWFNNDVDSLNFYENNKSLMEKDEIYIALNTLPVDGNVGGNVHLFSLNENIASLYWERNFVTNNKKIAIIGSGALSEQILEQALLMNVFSKKGRIDYVVIGNFDKYSSLHPSLPEVARLTGDTIAFSKLPWHSQMEIIDSCDRVILAGNTSDNTNIATMLENYGYKGELHLRADSIDTGVLFDSDKVMIFGTLHEVLGSDGENLFREGIQRDGKLFDATYNILCKVLEDESNQPINYLYSKPAQYWIDSNINWNSLSFFLKRSNYLAAKHSVVKKKIVERVLSENKIGIGLEEFIKDGVKGVIEFWFKPDNKTIIEELEEIEHIRWWRYYLLNNYTYNENVKKEDRRARRQNPNMKDYALLDDNTKRYDAIHYWLLAYDKS